MLAFYLHVLSEVSLAAPHAAFAASVMQVEQRLAAQDMLSLVMCFSVITSQARSSLTTEPGYSSSPPLRPILPLRNQLSHAHDV
jgi:hypothetical protein